MDYSRTRLFPQLGKALPLLLLFCSLSAVASEPAVASGSATIWVDPGDISKKDLAQGPGHDSDRPQLPVKFIEEDKEGHNAKFEVEDSRGTKWKAKVGIEAQPEVVATRLMWAIGYFTNENYFIPDLQVAELPAKLHRGQSSVRRPGHVEGVRLQRRPKKEKKTGNWSWRNNRFVGTREFNGLRVMMALLSNWDLKDENNAIYTDEDGAQRYLVTDLGTAFGASGDRWTEEGSKNNLQLYRQTKFIIRTAPAYVDFGFPRFPPFLYVFNLPHYVHQVRLRWVGNRVPRQDAKWLGSLLAQLSAKQIQDAFLAGGYPSEEAAAFAQAVQSRIAALNRL